MHRVLRKTLLLLFFFFLSLSSILVYGIHGNLHQIFTQPTKTLECTASGYLKPYHLEGNPCIVCSLEKNKKKRGGGE